MKREYDELRAANKAKAWGLFEMVSKAQGGRFKNTRDAVSANRSQIDKSSLFRYVVDICYIRYRVTEHIDNRWTERGLSPRRDQKCSIVD